MRGHPTPGGGSVEGYTPGRLTRLDERFRDTFDGKRTDGEGEEMGESMESRASIDESVEKSVEKAQRRARLAVRIKAFTAAFALFFAAAIAMLVTAANMALADDVVHSEGAYTATEWDEGASPDYIRVAGRAIIRYADVPRDGKIHYGGLDALGRATWAAGYITPELWKRELMEDRATAKLPDPAGWRGNTRVTIPGTADHRDYNGYFYNRSHLVADSLGGDPIVENLVAGTRMQNVGANDGMGGMAYTESAVRGYMHLNPTNTVYYSATPVYVGDELVPRSVYVDVFVQDGSIDEHVEVYNAAKGYAVDYATGAWEQGDPNSTRAGAESEVEAPTWAIVQESAQSHDAPEKQPDSPGKDTAFIWMVRWGCAALASLLVLILIAFLRKWSKPQQGEASTSGCLSDEWDGATREGAGDDPPDGGIE